MNQNQLLKKINEITSENAYLVGGFVRDLLMGKEFRDIDLVVAGSARETINRLAVNTGIKVVVLDRKHDLIRVVSSNSHFDVTGLNGSSLEKDLLRRDFSLNAIALPVTAYIAGDNWVRHIIDPLNGREDIHLRVIRACSTRSFEDDPLRVLRAVRLQQQLNFVIEQNTLKLASNMQNSLSAVPGERVWEELGHIFQLSSSGQALAFLERQTRVLEQIFPESGSMREMEQNYYHADNVWEHCLKTLVLFEEILDGDLLTGEIKAEVREYLAKPLGGVRKRLPVVKLACLFHDLGKLKTRAEREDGRITFYGHHTAGGPMVETIANRLKFSKRESKLLRLLVEWHMQPLFLYKDYPSSARSVLRFFRNLGEETPACLLLSLADVSSSRLAIGRDDLARMYQSYILELLTWYFRVKDVLFNFPPLLTGNDICQIFELEPSPLIGRLKDSLLEAQMVGKVKTRQAALNYLKALIAAGKCR